MDNTDKLKAISDKLEEVNKNLTDLLEMGVASQAVVAKSAPADSRKSELVKLKAMAALYDVIVEDMDTLVLESLKAGTAENHVDSTLLTFKAAWRLGNAAGLPEHSLACRQKYGEDLRTFCEAMEIE